MSTTIDQKVVEMQFDNRNFEKNVSATMSTLDKLKQSLNLTGATKGLENVDAAARRLDMTGVSNAVETVRAKFSALEVMGVTALANITNSAVNAGKRIVSALTIDPIKTGFSEYETQINAVQTILANTSSKGTTLDDVNGALDTLNKYADKTIYNFTEMTRNIGTFTAAGVDLDKSVSAIQGIANLAAVSGSTSQQASTAMYQLSQALASGSVKLQDWNSVVNAGMGGQVFQDALKRTAKVMGTDVDALIKKYGSFRESLSKGEWLTTDVLTKTLEQFTMAAEEGSEEWNKFKKSLMDDGYTEAQATEILKMANTATDAATKVKTFTQLWDTLKEAAQSGWTQTWEILVGDFEEAKALLTNISDVVGDFINNMSNARNTMLQGWKDMGGRTLLIEALTNVFKGLLSIIKPVSEAFKEIFPSITSEQLYKVTEDFKKLTDNFKLSDEQAAKLKTTFKALFSAVKVVADGALMMVKAIAPLGGFIIDILSGALDLTGSFTGWALSLKDAGKITDIFSKAMDDLAEVCRRLHERFKPLEAIGNFVKDVFTGVKNVIADVAPAFAGLGTSIASAFNTSGNTFKGSGLLDLFNSGVFVAMLMGVKKGIKAFSDLGESIGGLGGITEILDGVKDSLSAFQMQLKAGTLLKIATAIAVLSVSLVALALIDPARLTSALAGMTAMFIELFAAMTAFEHLAGTNKKAFKSLSRLVTPMIGLAAAVLILSAAMSKLAKMNWEELAKGIIGVAGAAAILVASASVLSQNTGGIAKSALGLVIFATAINVLAKAVEKLGGLSVKELIKGFGSVGVLVAELALFMKYANFDSIGISSGTGLLIMSAALVVMANAVKQFADINSSSLLKGVGAVAVVLAEIAVFSKLSKGAGNITGTAMGMLILAGAMNVMAIAIKALGGMEDRALGNGIIALGAALGIIAGAMHLMNGTLAGSAAMLIMAGALAILTPQLMLLGTLSLEEIGMGLLAMAGAFTVIGVAGLLLGPLVPTLLGLSAAIALFGVGAMAVGAGLMLFSTGLATLAASGVGAATAIVTIITAITGLIPMILTQIGNGIIAFANVITQGAPAIGAAITSVIISLVQTILMSVPKLVEGIMILLTTLLTTLLEHAPKFIDAGVQLLLALLQGIAKNIGDVVKVAIEIAVNFINGVASMLGDIIDAGINLIVNFINGMANGIRDHGPEIINAVWNLFDSIVGLIIDTLVSSIDNVTKIGGDIIVGLVDGITRFIKNAVNAAGKVVDNIMTTIEKTIPDFMDIGGNIIDGLIKGLTGGVGKIVNAATGVAKKAYNAAKNFLGINSPSKEFMKLGEYSDEGFAKGLERYSYLASDAAESVGDNALDTLRSSLANMSLGSVDGQPTIRPVLDLSNIESGAKRINGMLGLNPSVRALANVGAINSMMTNNQNGFADDIVSAISDLKNTLKNTSGATYNIDGVTYDDGSNITNAVKTIVRAAKVERRT